MKSLVRCFSIACLGLFAAITASAAPANDTFANAIPLTGPVVTTTGSNVGATKPFGPNGEPGIAGNFGGANVWWTWTATASGPTTIDTMGSDFNTLLGVYTGEAGNRLTTIAQNNDYNGNTWSRVEFNAVAGTLYRIQVDGLRTGGGFGTVATGNIVLHIMGVGGVSIDTPTNGMVFTLGDSIPVNVSFTADFPDPPATRVDFYLGGTQFASISDAPFSAVASNAPAGSNTLYAVAVNSAGTAIQSPTVTIFVQRVGVTLLTPAEDAVFLNTNPITVTAHGYLPSGSITNIEFFVDGLKFGEDATAPFSAVWSNVVGGSHRLTAIGRSDAGVAYNSQPVNIGVASLLVHSNAVWKYLDNGSDQGTTWTAPSFDDSAWASGPAELGYGDGDERTVVNSGPTNNYYATTYFRHAFVASSVASIANLSVLIAYDDAGVVYLNGVELYRAGTLPTNATYSTYTGGAAIEETVDVATRSAAALVEGTNVLAVEIHQQAATSSDISFYLQLSGLPRIIHNLSPTVGLTNPPNNAYFLAPSDILLEAEAADSDGSVARVEFYPDGVKVGEAMNFPYSANWTVPPIGPHSLTAVAVDDQGARTESAPVSIIVYDAVGTPYIQILTPTNGTAVEGGTNLLISVFANAPTGVTNVQFFADGTLIGEDSTGPFSLVWDAPFGTNSLTAVAFDATGASNTSPAVTLIAFPNTVAPHVLTQIPLAGSTLTNFTNLVVTFTEPVKNVDASDLLVSGLPATGVTGSGATYTFTFPQPPYGEVEIAWMNGHGITDLGYPTNLAFNELSPDAQWEYDLVDKTPPTIASRTPAPGATVTNLSQISVTFSELVTGVEASDLLVNGTPAMTMTGSGSNYVFQVTQPSVGTVNITWATNNDIFDLAETPNAFNRTSGAWSFTLDTRVVLIQSNSFWRFVKGTNEASTPATAWRQPGFDDSSWSNSQAPFFFGDPYTNFSAGIFGTLLSDMQSNYTTIFLRKEFTVESRGAITNLLINHQSDDGFIAWLNGIEVLRYNVPGGELPYNATASTAANEPSQTGAAYIVATLTNNAVSRLVNGANILAIQALNQNLTNSSDFGFNAQLYYFPIDATVVPPRLVSAEPAPGDVFYLTNVTISFSEGVSGVDAGDLLVNGLPATAVSTTTNSIYTFSFPQPPYGPVLITWTTNHGITDFDNPPKSFDGAAAASTVSYTLLNPSSPRIASQTPPASTTLTGLTSITVTFTEPVTGVDASDLLVSGAPASAVASADNTSYTFTFAQPPFGVVAIRWATNHGITDLELPPAPFDPTRFGGQWNYTLINPVPSVTLTSPTNNAFVLAPANVPLRATASDNDGTVALVEFYEGTDKLGEGTNAPYSLTVSNVPVGAYVFRAVVTDDQGLRGTSAPVVLNVVTSLPITLVRGPYLQIGSPTGGVVRWRTDFISDAVVFYGTDLANLTNIAVQTSVTNEHIVKVSGLQPDTKYFYSIGSAGHGLVGGTNDGENYWFKTSPPVGTRRPFRIWALGDSGTAGMGQAGAINQGNVRDAFYSFAATNGPPDFWLMLGDNAYNSGTDAEHQTAVFNMYPTTLRNLFLWPTIGNHESAQSFTATDFPYLNIFSLPHDGEAGGVPSGTQKYYSFDYGNIHFTCLDSMTSGRTTNTAMVQWLQNDLAAATAEWLIVFFHHPPYTRGNHNSDNETELIEIRQNILPILEAYGVDLVLCGHSHAWERSYLLNGHYGLSGTLTDSMKVDGGDGREDGTGVYRKNDEGQGTVYLVAGNGGQITGGQLNHPAHFISLNELGSVVLDVSGNRLDLMMLATNGAYRDHFTLLKPDPFPAAPLNLVALPTSSTEINLAWTAGSTNQAGYSIERSLDGVNFTELLTLAADATNALDTGLLDNATYFYRVRATNAIGASDYSNVASATTVMPTSPPRAPIALAASADNGVEFYRSQMVLRWQDRSTNEAGFQIERSPDGSSFVPVATVAANITYYPDHNLDSATPYYYRVRAFNALGLSAPSNPAEEMTHPQSQLARAGESVTFHAGVEGATPIRYQWRFMDAPLAGQTNESLVLLNVQPFDEGDYNVVVTDAAGRFISNPAYLFVLAPPRIVVQPQNQTNLVGTTASLSVVVDGTAPFIYRWRRNGALLAGATGPTLTFANVQLDQQAGYDVIVENGFGSITSRVATLIVNAPPTLAAIPDIMAEVLTPVTISNVTIDPNVPPLNLVYSFAPGAPTNARLNVVTGHFTWTPNRAQAPSTNPITILVADAARPLLSNSVTFTVYVNDYIELTAGSVVMNAGETNSVPIDLFSSAELLGLECVLEFSGDRLKDVWAESLAPQLATVSLQLSDSNTAALLFAALPGQSLQGTQHLARLNFTAASGQTSTFVPLHLSSMNSERAAVTGLEPTLLATDGRVVVLGTQSLLDAHYSALGRRELTLYGKRGVTYTIQYATNLANPAWTLRGTVTLTTNFGLVPVGNTPPPPAPAFFRARQ